MNRSVVSEVGIFTTISLGLRYRTEFPALVTNLTCGAVWPPLASKTIDCINGVALADGSCRTLAIGAARTREETTAIPVVDASDRQQTWNFVVVNPFRSRLESSLVLDFEEFSCSGTETNLKLPAVRYLLQLQSQEHPLVLVSPIYSNSIRQIPDSSSDLCP